jgi:hypothetical protein
MALSDETYVLLEGDTILDAALSLGWTTIGALLRDPEDVSRKISVDIFQKKKRGILSIADVMKYWQLLKFIYREREMSKQRADGESSLNHRNLDIIIAKRLDLGQNTLKIIGYLARHAPPELIRQVDNGEMQVKTAYKKLKEVQMNQAEPVSDEHNASTFTADSLHIAIPISDISIIGLPFKNNEAAIKLALNMIDYGLLKPIKVMALNDGKYHLLDGNKRLEAANEIGWTEIEASVYEAELAGRMMDDIIAERKVQGRFTILDQYMLVKTLTIVSREIQRQRIMDSDTNARQRIYNEVERSIAARLNVSRNHIAKVIYLANNASEDILRQVDNGGIGIKKACRIAAEKSTTVTSDIQLGESLSMPELSANDEQQSSEEAEPSPDRIAELEEQVRQEYYRANIAEAQLRDLKESQWNQIYHRDGIIESLKATVRTLRERLAAYGDTVIGKEDVFNNNN